MARFMPVIQRWGCSVRSNAGRASHTRSDCSTGSYALKILSCASEYLPEKPEMKLSLESVLLAGLLLFSAIPASAAIIFDAGPPTTAIDSTYLSDVDASASGSGIVQQVGGFFILEEGASTITDIHWWGIYGADNSGQQALHDDDFTIRVFLWNDPGSFVELPAIYQNNVGNGVNRTDTGLDVPITGTDTGVRLYDLFSYWVDIDPLELVPNTFYLLSIFNDTTGHINSWSWSQSSTDSGVGTSAFRSASLASPDGLGWNLLSGDVAFHLTAVPEPTVLLLLGLGLAGLGFTRRH